MTRSLYAASCLVLAVSLLSGCDNGYDKDHDGDRDGEKTQLKPEEVSMDAKSGAYRIMAKIDGAEANNEGVMHYQQGHWDVAREHFQKAAIADDDVAEIHYNLALALDKLGKHEEATEHFKEAMECAAKDSPIRDSAILKKHLGM